MKHGISNPNNVDLIIKTKDGDAVVVLVEDGPWSGSDEELERLDKKLGNYCGYIIDGQLVRTYPEFVGRHVTVHVKSFHWPDPRTQEYFDRLTAWLADHEIGFEFNVMSREDNDA
ncbi:MAG: hypothetical protein K1X53_08865 [Candidatus Sumerlaeaceae bacterium]|nr:hypothetical protein [Candidatus Sumerlaeaceae bacterium]